MVVTDLLIKTPPSPDRLVLVRARARESMWDGMVSKLDL